MKKKVVTSLMAIGLTITLNVTVMADTLSQLKNKKATAEKQRQEYIKSKEKTVDEVEEREKDIEMFDAQIEALKRKISKNNDDLEKCKANIENAENNVQAAEEDVVKQQELLDKRLRAIYKNGSTGYLSIVLESDGFTDLINRIEAVNKMVSFDKKAIKELDDKRSDLIEKKNDLDNEKLKLEKIKSDNEKQKLKMEQSINQQKVLIAKAKEEMDDFDKKINDYFNLIMDLKEQIAQKEEEEREKERLKNLANKTSRGNENYSTDEVVIYALKFRGIDYQWGGNTPDEGFDCSGYVRYVYAHFGVNLPRTSDEQFNVGKKVARDELQPGDLVFFGSGNNPHHVGMYIGDNCYIHAPRTGDVVKISVLNRDDYIGARRVK